MPYDERTPGNSPLVIVEWLDIADDENVIRRWSVGWLVDEDLVSEGRECIKIYGTWDEDGWDDPSTFKKADVEYIDYVGED
jgi:hypothetical protein